MDLNKLYHDSDGSELNILAMVKCEPEWAAERIQQGEKAISRIAELEAALVAEKLVKERS